MKRIRLNKVEGFGCHHSPVDRLRLSFCHPGFESQAHHICFYLVIYTHCTIFVFAL